MSRALVLIPLAGLLVCTSSGCISSAIATRGRDLGGVRSRAQARSLFGPPEWTECDPDGSVECYHYRGLVCEKDHEIGAGWLACFTLGLSEAYLIPEAIVKQGKNVTLGNKLTFWFDQAGEVRRWRRGDERERRRRSL